MKKILLILCIAAAAGFASCVKDKGNYDYDYLPEYILTIDGVNPSKLVETNNNSLLEFTPVFLNVLGDTVDLPFDDYQFTWNLSRSGEIDQSQLRFISDEPTLNRIINQPTGQEHTLWLKAINKMTEQRYMTNFRIKLVDKYTSAYIFLTEDEERNVDMDIYGYAPDGEEYLRNYLSDIGYTGGLGGGANAVMFDSWSSANRIIFSCGESISWLNGSNFSWDEVNKVTSLIPMSSGRSVVITNMHRVGAKPGDGTSGQYVHKFFYFDDQGGAYIASNTALAAPSINVVNAAGGNSKKIELAPMVGAYRYFNGTPETYSAVMWSRTDKKLVCTSIYAGVTASVSSSCYDVDDMIGKNLDDCLFLGGSQDQPMIAVVRDVDGAYWRLNLQGFDAGSRVYKAMVKDGGLRRLAGTETLGDIKHWINSHTRGYLYTIVGDNQMYNYVESQVGGVADPGWTRVTITEEQEIGGEKVNVPVTIEDPVSFVHMENSGKNDIYVFTYSETNGGTLYLLRPGAVGSELTLNGKLTGLGNAKKMCYWWT